MATNGETPGIGGVAGIGAPVTRAPKAWNDLLRALHRDLPKSLGNTSRLRHSIRNRRR